MKANLDKNGKLLRPIPWEQFDYNRDHLIQQAGFVEASGTTMVMVGPDRDGRYAVKVVYGLLDSAEEMLALCGEVYTKRRPHQPKEVRGLSKFGRRGGKKAEHGSMVMLGSHNFIPGSGHKAVGYDKAMPAIYNPKQPIDRNTNALMLEHADALSELEHRTIPALAYCRDEIADKHDPERIHRLSDRCSAFALSLALHYVVTSHDDSGKAAEGILFVNATGPLPPGHSWDFVVGGHILPLPNERGKAAFIFVEGEGVQHGTLPTSATEPTCDHGNFGSALVTKDKTIQ
eukprot:7144735-Prymnesium_polylepis.1